MLSMKPYRLLKPREVAAFLCVTVWTLKNYRDRGAGPPFVRLLPKTIRYPSDELEAWLKEAISAGRAVWNEYHERRAAKDV